ncbi:MAG TPA: tetratricopeptide repeat protein [Anaerolineae bacterium]|nr:tetratricopeptide repeat protein [Anaerolineae bacterium]
MKIRIWGTRGSIPSPLDSGQIEEKLYQAILGMPAINTQDPEAVRAYIKKLPPLIRGTTGGNTPCIEVQAHGQLIVLDAGSGLYPLGLELMKGPFGKGKGTLHLFISHTHWDHIQGFPMFTPAFIPGNRIFIYGAHDLKKVFEIQQNPLTWPVTLSYMNADIQFIHVEPGKPINIGKVRVETIKNAHPGDAYSYRLEDQYSTFVYASDAEYKKLEGDVVDPYVAFFRNADALVFDAMYTLQDAWLTKEDWGHSSAMIGVDLAQAAGVKRLILFHHDPSYSDATIEQIYKSAVEYQAQSATPGALEMIIACEGMTLDLTPAGAVDLQFTPNGETAIVTPTSVFDEHGVDELARQLTRLRDAYSPTSSIIDLSQVETFTTASLKSLVAFHQKWGGKPIILTAPSEKVKQIIKLGGYGDFFTIYPTVEAALAAVQAREALNLPGQVIKNRYRIEAKIGESALGTVLKATDIETNQPVVLKILSPAFSAKTIEWFMHQTPQIVALDHPNIVKVYAWDKEENYVLGVEEYVPHPTLQDILDEQSNSHDQEQPSQSVFPGATRFLDIALDIIHALEYAHSHGVILGDLKPQNIFITPQGARLSGWGLGRLEEGRNLLDTPKLFLTAAYLAPEQILGQTLDARTDLYAFGVILYQLFTGRLPFEASASSIPGTVTTDSPEQMVMRSRLRYSPRSPREFNPHISISLEHLILKLLDQNPNNRYASAQQVKRILANLLSDIEYATRPRARLLVGREKQVQILRACWEEASAGHGQLAFITGEAGIGKTRLAQQVAAQCHPPVLLTGHCEDVEGRSAYRLFTEVLRTYLGTVPPEFFDAEARQQLSNFTPLIPEIHQMLPDLPIPPALDPKQEQLRLMTSLTQFIQRATQERTWFLILEDLQWADRSSLELLLYLGRHLPTMHIFIIGTYRDTEVPRGHPLLETLRGLRSHPSYRHIPLERLSQEEVAFVLTYIWQRAVPQALVERIYEHTAGNPFYVEEVAKGLEDEGLIPPPGEMNTDSEWYERALEEVRLPQSVRETVWRRIEHLSTETQALLRQAAVLGETFRFDDLQRMSDLSEWEVLEHLDEALERQLVEEVPGGVALRFRQSEIQYVIYTELGPLRRRLLHRKAGEALEYRAAGHTALLAEALAHHFSEAGEPAKAIRYSLQAARQALLAYANENALQWIERALTMLSQLSPQDIPEYQSQLLLAHQLGGMVLTLTGQYDEALKHYAAVHALLKAQTPSVEQRRQLASLCYEIANIYELRDEYNAVFAWLRQGLDAVADDEPTVEAARIYLLGAKVYARQGENDKALAWCHRSLEIATRIPTPEGIQTFAAALNTQASIDIRLGNLDNAAKLSQESLRAYQQIGDLVGESHAYINLASVYELQGKWDQADEAYQCGWAIKREIGDVYGQAVSSNNLANLYLKRGEWKGAQELYERSLAIWETIHTPRGEAAALINLAQVYIHLQQWEQAQGAIERAQKLLNEIGSKEFLAELERLWGEYYRHTGDLEQALTHIQKAIGLADAYSDPLERGIAQRVLGEIYLSRGNPRFAAAALQTGLLIFNNLNNEHEAARTKLALARLALTSGDIAGDTAQNYLEQAIRSFEKLDARDDLAQAQALKQQLA